MKRKLSLLLSVVLILGILAGCANTGAPSNTSTDTSTSTTTPVSTDTKLEPMELTLELWGDKPNQMDDVLAEFYNRTKDTLNMTLKINWTPMDEYINNVNLKLSAGEKIDFNFDAPWQNMTGFIAQGIYRDLTPYFNNPDYAGLQKAFSGDIYYNNLFDGKMMGIPLTQSYGGGSITYIRGDLREKYGMDPIDSLEDFEAYLQKVKENEPNMIPFVMLKTGDYGASSLIQMDDPDITLDPVRAGIWPANLGTSVDAQFYIEDYVVKDVYISSVEPVSEKADFPAPFNTRDISVATKMREWYDKGYLEKDLITRDDASGTFTAGKAASFMWTDSQYNMVLSGLTASVPDAKLEFYIHDRLTRENTKGLTSGNFKAWNFVCIPVTTDDAKAERIMMFMDWLFDSSENHDLFEYGIDGKNFVAVGNDRYTYPEGLDLATNYNFPWYQLTGNPLYLRIQDGLPEVLYNEVKFVQDPETYYNPLLSGFTFNPEPVLTEISNPDFVNIHAKIKAATMLAQASDIEAEIAKIEKEYSGLKALQEDVAAIKAEAMKQVQAYLDTRKEFDKTAGTKYPQ